MTKNLMKTSSPSPLLPRITRVKTLQLSSVILQDNLKIHSLYRPAHRNLLLLFLCYLKIISPQIFFIFRIHNIAKVAAIAKLLYDSHSHGVLLQPLIKNNWTKSKQVPTAEVTSNNPFQPSPNLLTQLMPTYFSPY